jgi:hypothetical protein
MCSIERIMTAENPNWRSISCDPASTGIEDRLAAPARQRIGQ